MGVVQYAGTHHLPAAVFAMYIGPWQEYNLAKHSRHLLNQTSEQVVKSQSSSTSTGQASNSTFEANQSDYGTPQSQQQQQHYHQQQQQQRHNAASSVPPVGSSLRRRLPPSSHAPPTNQNRGEGYSRILAAVVPASSSSSYYSPHNNKNNKNNFRPPQTPPPPSRDLSSTASYMSFQQRFGVVGGGDGGGGSTSPSVLQHQQQHHYPSYDHPSARSSPSVRSDGARSTASEPLALPSYYTAERVGVGVGVVGGNYYDNDVSTKTKISSSSSPPTTSSAAKRSDYNPALAARLLKISRQRQLADEGATAVDGGAMFKRFFAKAVTDGGGGGGAGGKSGKGNNHSALALAAPTTTALSANLAIVEARKRAYLAGLGGGVEKDIDGDRQRSQRQQQQQHSQQHVTTAAPPLSSLPVPGESKKQGAATIKNIELSDEAFNLVAHYFQDDDDEQQPDHFAGQTLHNTQHQQKQHSPPGQSTGSAGHNRSSPNALLPQPLHAVSAVPPNRQFGVLSHPDLSPSSYSSAFASSSSSSSSPSSSSPPYKQHRQRPSSPLQHLQQQQQGLGGRQQHATRSSEAEEGGGGTTPPRTPGGATNYGGGGGASVDELIHWVGGLDVDD